MAGGFVFDTRLDPVHDLITAERRPAIVVLTEEDNGDPIAQSGPRYYKRVVDVVCELSIPAAYTQNGETFIGPDISDAAHEFALDLLEAQVRFVLHFGPTGFWWRKLAILPAIDIRSLPFRDTEEGIRLALRTLRIKVTLRNDDAFDPTPAVAPTGIDRLPEPLQSFIAALPDDHYGRQVALGLAAQMPAMPAATPLQTVTLGGKVTNPAGTIPAAANVQAQATDLDD
jgi:hypothetical protein